MSDGHKCQRDAEFQTMFKRLREHDQALAEQRIRNEDFKEFAEEIKSALKESAESIRESAGMFQKAVADNALEMQRQDFELENQKSALEEHKDDFAAFKSTVTAQLGELLAPFTARKWLTHVFIKTVLPVVGTTIAAVGLLLKVAGII